MSNLAHMCSQIDSESAAMEDMHAALPKCGADQLEAKVIELALAVFSDIGSQAPHALNKNYWTTKIMQWSMGDPALKTNLFRLVDVLPSLKTSAAVYRHVREYLAAVLLAKPEFTLLRPIIEWGLSGPDHGLRAKICSFAVSYCVHQMARVFIAGESAEAGASNLYAMRQSKLAFTVDLLGEYCVSDKEALQYLERYLQTLEDLSQASRQWSDKRPLVLGHPADNSPLCISVKLSALYSQCSVMNFSRSIEVIASRLSAIVRQARQVDARVYVDAEDSSTNTIIYEVYKQVFGSKEFKAFELPGIVVQAYSRRSPQIVDDLLDFSAERQSPIAVRLVKGAYWDQEVIAARQNSSAPGLFEIKQHADANYEFLSRKLLDHADLCVPAFGSHNIRSLAHACCYAESIGLGKNCFELQMLYGMAEPIARSFASRGYLVRLYVPLGNLVVGMGYLVRRLLENTSNESFLRNTFYDQKELLKLLEQPRMSATE